MSATVTTNVSADAAVGATVEHVPGTADQGVARPYLSVRDLRKVFAGDKGVKGISFDVAEGEFVTLLGSSGCGKTTTLRCLSGVESPDSGQILVAGEPMWSDVARVSLPPERRDVGVVFQSYALWPHMTVRRNIAYPLLARGVTKKEADGRADEMLTLVGLLEHADKRPAQLSGGQQQRVALARALVYKPKLLLLDEPLSNLDAQLREAMRRDIRRIQRQMGITAVYVTHDRIEAMTMSDRIIVMSDGQIDQIGTPHELYTAPQTQTVAALLTSASLVRGDLAGGPAAAGERVSVEVPELRGAMIGATASTDLDGNSAVSLCIRPRDVRIDDVVGDGMLRGTIADLYSTGGDFEYVVDLGGVTVKGVTAEPVDASVGDTVGITLDPARTGCVARRR